MSDVWYGMPTDPRVVAAVDALVAAVSAAGRGARLRERHWYNSSSVTREEMVAAMDEARDAQAAAQRAIYDLADSLHAEAALNRDDRRVLRDAAAWVADVIGYPVETKMPDAPPPAALFDALVDHVHADTGGRWHGGELSRDEVDSWLRDEAAARSTASSPSRSVPTATGASDDRYGSKRERLRPRR